MNRLIVILILICTILVDGCGPVTPYPFNTPIVALSTSTQAVTKIAHQGTETPTISTQSMIDCQGNMQSSFEQGNIVGINPDYGEYISFRTSPENMNEEFYPIGPNQLFYIIDGPVCLGGGLTLWKLTNIAIRGGIVLELGWTGWVFESNMSIISWISLATPIAPPTGAPEYVQTPIAPPHGVPNYMPTPPAIHINSPTSISPPPPTPCPTKPGKPGRPGC